MKTNIICKRSWQRIDEPAKEISRVNEALGVGLVTIEDDGIYREFKNGETMLIKAGDFSGERRV